MRSVHQKLIEIKLEEIELRRAKQYLSEYSAMVEVLNEELSLLKKENELLTISNDFYADKNSWHIYGFSLCANSVNSCDISDIQEGFVESHGGKLARETKTKIQDLRRGEG